MKITPRELRPVELLRGVAAERLDPFAAASENAARLAERVRRGIAAEGPEHVPEICPTCHRPLVAAGGVAAHVDDLCGGGAIARAIGSAGEHHSESGGTQDGGEG